jgi:uncharacterized ferritin-like protein (DUF455 family)
MTAGLCQGPKYEGLSDYELERPTTVRKRTINTRGASVLIHLVSHIVYSTFRTRIICHSAKIKVQDHKSYRTPIKERNNKY